VATTRIVAVRGKSLEFRADRVVGEEPLEIRAAGPGQDPIAVAVTLRTPGFEDELAIGFLRTEGLIEGREVIRVTMGDPATMSQPDDQVTVRLAHAFDASRIAERHFVATASCGICGKASLDEVAVRSAPIPDGPVVPRSVVLALPDLLRDQRADGAQPAQVIHGTAGHLTGEGRRARDHQRQADGREWRHAGLEIHFTVDHRVVDDRDHIVVGFRPLREWYGPDHDATPAGLPRT